MATFKEVQDRINNEYLNRTTFIEETKTAIKAAIRFYEKRRWVFNETAVALATSAGAIDVSFPDNFLILDHIALTDAGENFELRERNYSELLNLNAQGHQAQPTHYAVYNQNIQLHPIPETIYAIQIGYVKRLETISAATDTNAWLEDFQDVICYHAAKLVWGMSIRNDKEAAKFASLEQMALQEIDEHFIRTVSGRITPSGYF